VTPPHESLWGTGVGYGTNPSPESPWPIKGMRSTFDSDPTFNPRTSPRNPFQIARSMQLQRRLARLRML